MFAKVHPAEDVKSGNTGSCHDLVRYLEKETGEGQRHIYTLIFGGGYTDQGMAVLNPIKFDAETTDWVEAANSDVNVKP